MRSTSSTASGSSPTSVAVARIASRKVGNWHTPNALRGLIGESFTSSAAENASVPSDPTSSRGKFTSPGSIASML